MRNYRTVAIVLILVGLLSVPAQAQVIPGRWEKVAALKLGPPYTRALGHQKISFFIASLDDIPQDSTHSISGYATRLLHEIFEAYCSNLSSRRVQN